MSSNVTLKETVAKFIDKYFSYLKGKSIENPHITKSLLLHLFLLIAATGMLPRCSRDIERPRTIAVDIMPMGDAQKTTPKVEQPKPLPPKEAKKPVEATKMEKAEKPKPVAKPEEKKPAPKKVEKKPEPEKKKEDQQKKDTQDQEGKKKLLKDLEKKEQAQLDDIFADAAKDAPKIPPQASGKSDVIDPAFVNELMGKIQSQVSQNWNIPIGAKDVQNVQVRLFIALLRDGTVTDVRIMDQIQYNTDNSFRVIADSAVWAVKDASPIQGLPAEKYDIWKEIEFTFDPSQAL